MRRLCQPAARAAVFLLLMFLSAAGFWASLITVARWNDLWSGGDFYRSGTLDAYLTVDTRRALDLAGLYLMEDWDGSLSYRDGQRRQSLMELLDAGATNFRFQVHDQLGNRLCGNVAEGALERAVNHVSMTETTARQTTGGQFYLDTGLNSGTFYVNVLDDYVIWDDERHIELLNVYVNGTPLIFPPEDAAGAARYGWFFEGDQWVYRVDEDSRVKSCTLVLEYGLADPLTVQDQYVQLREQFKAFQGRLPVVAAAALVLDLAAGILLVLLCTTAGRRRDREEIVLGWQDRMPYDLYLLLAAGAIVLVLGAGDAVAASVNERGISAGPIAALGILSLGMSGCAVALILTTVTRAKMHTLIENTLIVRLCRWLGRALRRLVQRWPLIWRAGLVFGLYVLLSVLCSFHLLAFLLVQLLALWLMVRWLGQWKAIRAGTERIVGGSPGYTIDTKGMFPDLRAHADQLNDLGRAISTAVEDRLRNERFKTELITNVSHDLKTPLTSIINYVDLLKKEPIDNPRARGYLEVLERKSQRLKKLTEDLIEASKASTGALSVVKSRLGVDQLLEQAAAEYQEKLDTRGLTLVFTPAESECYVDADGRHLWRVIDNLLGNCYKYALEGTRIYLSVATREGEVTITVKNISRDPLNLPPEQLMERFVRGEASRTTEGSGLGLSIACSLTELQGGRFHLEIDGDLFKAIVSLPEAPAQQAGD